MHLLLHLERVEGKGNVLREKGKKRSGCKGDETRTEVMDVCSHLDLDDKNNMRVWTVCTPSSTKTFLASGSVDIIITATCRVRL